MLVGAIHESPVLPKNSPKCNKTKNYHRKGIIKSIKEKYGEVKFLAVLRNKICLFMPSPMGRGDIAALLVAMDEVLATDRTRRKFKTRKSCEN